MRVALIRVALIIVAIGFVATIGVTPAAAQQAGMWAVGISHTYSPAQLRQSGADAVIHGLETLTPSWIEHHFVAETRPRL